MKGKSIVLCDDKTSKVEVETNLVRSMLIFKHVFRKTGLFFLPK